YGIKRFKAVYRSSNPGSDDRICEGLGFATFKFAPQNLWINGNSEEDGGRYSASLSFIIPDKLLKYVEQHYYLQKVIQDNLKHRPYNSTRKWFRANSASRSSIHFYYALYHCTYKSSELIASNSILQMDRRIDAKLTNLVLNHFYFVHVYTIIPGMNALDGDFSSIKLFICHEISSRFPKVLNYEYYPKMPKLVPEAMVYENELYYLTLKWKNDPGFLDHILSYYVVVNYKSISDFESPYSYLRPTRTLYHKIIEKVAFKQILL
ncbi:unnamed protein product, partial [Gordionus sp. m RMFG-2023]